MTMSTHVYGIVPPDEEFLKMKRVYDACSAAGVEPPDDVINFFDGERPDDSGVVVHIGGDYSEPTACCGEYNDDNMSTGFEIDLSELDPKFKKIRFVNSY